MSLELWQVLQLEVNILSEFWQEETQSALDGWTPEWEGVNWVEETYQDLEERQYPK